MLACHELLWAVEWWILRWGCWLIVGDGGGGLGGGLLQGTMTVVGCWGYGGIGGHWRCWRAVGCCGWLLSACWGGIPIGVGWGWLGLLVLVSGGWLLDDVLGELWGQSVFVGDMIPCLCLLDGTLGEKVREEVDGKYPLRFAIAG